MATPLSRRWPVDRLFWCHTKQGDYTVKSGYWLAKLGRGTPCSDGGEVWARIWSIEGPPRLRHFLWRAYKGCLAVKERLFQRHITENAYCLICENAVETINHALFKCNFDVEIWKQMAYKKKLNVAGLLTIAALAWASWTCRNKVIFERNCTLKAKQVAIGFIKLVADYYAYARKVFPGGTKQTTSFTGLWQRPPVGVIKVNVDAHMGADGKEGLGAAEAMVVRYGIMLARRFGFQCIMVESDAANVVNIINSRLEGYSSLHILYDDIGFESSYFQFFSCPHVRRRGIQLLIL
ncbi:hypothetical protein RDABS01_023357 [Bienertia sinuspersici]